MSRKLIPLSSAILRAAISGAGRLGAFNQLKRIAIEKKYLKSNGKNVGSSEAQISALSEKINYLTNHFNKRDPQYSNSTKIQFDYLTNDTIVIVRKALEGLRRIYRPGYRYKKAGVIMHNLTQASSIQGLFEPNKVPPILIKFPSKLAGFNSRISIGSFVRPKVPSLIPNTCQPY